MPIAHRIAQEPGQVVSIADWDRDPDNPIGPQGAKPKQFVICPTPAPWPFLIAGHRYLYKHPTGTWAQQIWSEVIAYELARGTALLVPPAFLAVDESEGTVGVLVEFFLGYRDEPPEEFFHAIDRFRGLRIAVNERRGSLHANLDLTRRHEIGDGLNWWAKTVAFDALIGNTDRHSENWGFLLPRSTVGTPHYRLAPAFDNGTSLGFIIRDADLGRFREPSRMAALLAKGAHHSVWDEGSTKGAGHVELAVRLARHERQAAPEMEGMIAIASCNLEPIVERCTRFDFPIPFLPERASFVRDQVRKRGEAIMAGLRE